MGSVGCGIAGLLSDDDESRQSLFMWAGGLYAAQFIEALTSSTYSSLRHIKTVEEMEKIIRDARGKKPTVNLRISHYVYKEKTVVDTEKIRAAEKAK